MSDHVGKHIWNSQNLCNILSIFHNTSPKAPHKGVGRKMLSNIVVPLQLLHLLFRPTVGICTFIERYYFSEAHAIQLCYFLFFFLTVISVFVSI